MLGAAADDMAPHDVAFYLRDLAAALHSWYAAERFPGRRPGAGPPPAWHCWPRRGRCCATRWRRSASARPSDEPRCGDCRGRDMMRKQRGGLRDGAGGRPAGRPGAWRWPSRCTSPRRRSRSSTRCRSAPPNRTPPRRPRTATGIPTQRWRARRAPGLRPGAASGVVVGTPAPAGASAGGGRTRLHAGRCAGRRRPRGAPRRVRAGGPGGGERAPGASAAPGINYFVQAGAYAQPEDAEAQRAKVGLLGLAAKVMMREQSGRPVYRVRIGPFEVREEAEATQSRLGEIGHRVQPGARRALNHPRCGTLHPPDICKGIIE